MTHHCTLQHLPTILFLLVSVELRTFQYLLCEHRKTNHFYHLFRELGFRFYLNREVILSHLGFCIILQKNHLALIAFVLAHRFFLFFHVSGVFLENKAFCFIPFITK